MSRFQPGIAAMNACTGASPSAFAICGLPPEMSFTGLASLAPGLAFAPAFGGDLDLVADLRGLLARDVPLAFGFAMLSVIMRPFLLDVSRVALGVHPRTAHSPPSSPVRAQAAQGRGDSGVLDHAAARSAHLEMSRKRVDGAGGLDEEVEHPAPCRMADCCEDVGLAIGNHHHAANIL